MTIETGETELAMNDIRPQAAQRTLAANPLVGIRGHDIIDAVRMLLAQMARNPWVAARQYLSFLGELGRIATGGSELAPDDKDRRFTDPAWKESAAYRALAQCYLAWGHALNRFVDDVKMEERDAARARFVVALLVDAMSPTNSLGGNPMALKRLVDTGGASFVHPNSHSGMYLEARVWALASDPQTPERLFAGTDMGVFRWDEPEPHRSSY